MHHPDKYAGHNRSLEKFVDIFNEVANTKGNILKMEINKVENFRDDGSVINLLTAKKIIFDWEKRYTYYDGYGFPFPTFGQFERKIKKEEIKLSIQCSKDEQAFCYAWHEDFLKEKIEYIESRTKTGSETKGKRFTKNFTEYRYSGMADFHDDLIEYFKIKGE